MFKNVFRGFGHTVIRNTTHTKLLASKYSPEILTGVGIAAGIASTVFAAKATLKLDETLAPHKADMERVRESAGSVEGYTEKDAGQDLIKLYTRSSIDLFKLYLPAIGLGTLSVVCILGSTKIMRGRNAAIAAAYAGLDQAYRQYRKNVVEKYGEDGDLDLLMGGKEEIKKVKETDGSIQEKTVKTVGDIADQEYHRVFDDTNVKWNPHGDTNQFFLQGIQRSMNDRLKIRGSVFLNEVFDELGFPRTKAGTVVGWVANGDGDNFIDFGIVRESYDVIHKGDEEILTYDRNAPFHLFFNVDGVIHDMI